MAAPEKFNCLPDFIEAGGKANPWKRKLFYMLGYCDTYHDFHASRLKESKNSDENSAVIRTVKAIGSLSDYVIDSVIEKMDTTINWKDNVYTPIKGFITTKNKYTFENAMFAAFTKTIATAAGEATNLNTLAAKMGDGGKDYMEYLHESLKITQQQILDIQLLTMKDFQDGVPVVLSSIIELEMPAVLTQRDKISQNLQAFLHNCYANNKEAVAPNRLQFVEDTASFPRSIFDGFPAQRDTFVKIVTTQTQWDPAGVSDYHPDSDPAKSGMNDTMRNGKNISAPSFIATNTFANSGNTPFVSLSAYFTDKEIVRQNANPPLQLLKNKSGPSVNHLLLHMILNTPDLKLDADNTNPVNANLLKNVLKAASLSTKSKNITFNLDDGGDKQAKLQKLRNYTSSKRSGDYENIHSAMVFKALMFTGDEPAFTYGLMNRIPIVYHLKSETRHFFRFYIPPTNAVHDAISKHQKDLREYMHKATELDTIFGTSIDNYTKLFNTDIPGKLRQGIQVTGAMAAREKDYAKMLGEVFKSVLVNNIVGIKDTIENILTFDAVKETLDGSKKGYIRDINKKLNDLSKIDSTKLNEADEQAKFDTIKDELDIIFRGLDAEIKQAETKLSDVRDIIPHKLKGSLKAQTFQFYTLFEDVASNQSYFTDTTGSYKLNEIKILPDMPKIINLAFKELAKLVLNFERGGRIGGGYAFTDEIIIKMREFLTDIKCPTEISGLFKEGEAALPKSTDITTNYNYNTQYEVITNKFTADARAARIAAARAPQTGGRVDTMRSNPQESITMRNITQRNKFRTPQITKQTINKIRQIINQLRKKNPTITDKTIINLLQKYIPNLRNTALLDVLHKERSAQVTPSPAPHNTPDYQSLFEDITKNVGNLTPFGLKAEEYAASIVYRCAIVDKLHAFFYPSGKAEVEAAVDLDPRPTIVQTGGHSFDPSEEEVILYIQNEVLLPFLEQYFILDGRGKFIESFLNRVYDGSFIPDYIDVLDEIIGINKGAFTEGNASTIDTIQVLAFNAKKMLIDLASQNAKNYRIRFIHRQGGTTTKEREEIYNTFKTVRFDKEKLADDAINKIQSMVNYFYYMFTTTTGTETSDPTDRITNKTSKFFNYDTIQDIFCKGYEPPSNYTEEDYTEEDYTNALQDYLHFHFKTYLDLLYTKVPVAAARPCEGWGCAIMGGAVTGKEGEGVNGGGGLTRRRGGNTRRRRPAKKRPSKRRAPKRARKQSSKARK